MPFRKKDNGKPRPSWYIRLRLPSWGDTGTLSSFTGDKRRAERYEDLLRWLDRNEEFEILEALRPRGPGQSGKTTLPKVYKARRQNKIAQLRRQVTDPKLTVALRQVNRTLTYDNHKRGLRQIKKYAPDGAYLSYLTKPANINGLVASMRQDGYKPRSIANSLWGAISKVLQFHYGKAYAQSILRDAHRPSADDRRDKYMTAEQIHDVVSACEFEMRMYIIVLAGLGIDKTPCLNLRVEDVDLDRWTVYVRDTKNESRPRTLDLPPAVAYAFKVLCDGKTAQEKVFSLSSGQVAYRWRKVRKSLNLEGYREKDYRHSFAVAYLQAGGGNVATLQQRLGHRRPGQSVDYGRHSASGNTDMEKAAHAMGLKLPKRLRDELKAPKKHKKKDKEMPAWWFDRDAGPQPRRRYTERGKGGWSGEERKRTNREWMREYRQRKREERSTGTGT